MKKSLLSLTILLLLSLYTSSNYGQSVTLELFKGLAELQIGSVVSANGITNSQQYLSIFINNASGMDVQLENTIRWQKDLQSENQWVASATTDPFRVTSNNMRVTNLDIGASIQLKTSSYNDDVLDEIRKLGKFAGRLTVEVKLLIDNVEVGSASDILDLLNPANTLTIISPSIGSTWDEGNIPLQWNSISGASDYLVRCNTKKPFESNEEGLKSGQPLLWDKSVKQFFPGLAASFENGLADVPININLWDMFSGSRVPTPGNELVVQLVGVVPSTSVDTKLESHIVNFYINDPNSQRSPEQTQQFVESLRSYVINSNLSEQEQEDLLAFLSLVEAGEVSYQGVLDANGNVIPSREVQRILTYLQDNPDMIVSIKKR